MDVLIFVFGMAVGAAGVWLILRNQGRQAAEQARIAMGTEGQVTASKLDDALKRNSDLTAELAMREAQISEIGQRLTETMAQRSALQAKLEGERKASEEKLAVWSDAEKKLADAFKVLSAEALRTNNQSFLDLAQTKLSNFQTEAKSDLESRQKSIAEMVTPVKQSLEKVDGKLQELETKRTEAYADLRRLVTTLHEAQGQLRAETSNLVKALRSPAARGRWGEIQLRRVVEMAGMLDHCDFHEQQSMATEEGQRRPDLVVHLPAKKDIVVDAKAPLDAYLNAIEETDENRRRELMKEHAGQVRSLIGELSRKSYWSQFDQAPEFVVLFLPGENFFGAALEHDPSLIEFGVEQRVLIATPTTLIALLRAVAYGWKQESLAKNAREISDLGRDLYARFSTFGDLLAKIGKNLGQTIDAYNGAVGSLERRVLPAARRFKDLKAGDSGVEIEMLTTIDQTVREISQPELLTSSSHPESSGENES